MTPTKATGTWMLREEIDRQPLQRGGAQDHHGERQHQDADAIAKCEEGQPHNASAEVRLR